MIVPIVRHMAPYEPPIAHYTELDVSQYTDEQILTVIGKGGKGFYKLTSQLGLNYLWWDKERKVVELWGSFGALSSGAKDKLSSAISQKISSGSYGESTSNNMSCQTSMESTAIPGKTPVTAC
jgi:hypothetical protein